MRHSLAALPRHPGRCLFSTRAPRLPPSPAAAQDFSGPTAFPADPRVLPAGRRGLRPGHSQARPPCSASRWANGTRGTTSWSTTSRRSTAPRTGCQLQEIGRTYEQRRLLNLYVSAPKNLARLDEILERHALLSDGKAEGLDLNDLPLVVYLGYSIHGNESSGSNASLLVAYHLAAARGAAIDELLEHTLIVLDPSLNPDGLSRFAQWANQNRGRVPVADPRSREHVEPWPSGRTNHYGFDLNRDWLLGVNPESRARLAPVPPVAAEPALPISTRWAPTAPSSSSPGCRPGRTR